MVFEAPCLSSPLAPISIAPPAKERQPGQFFGSILVPETGPPCGPKNGTTTIAWYQKAGPFSGPKMGTKKLADLRPRIFPKRGQWQPFCCTDVLQECWPACAAAPQKWHGNGPIFGTTAPLQTPRCTPLSTQIGAIFWSHFWDHVSTQNGHPHLGHPAAAKWPDTCQKRAQATAKHEVAVRATVPGSWGPTCYRGVALGGPLSKQTLWVHIGGAPHYPTRTAPRFSDDSGSEQII